MMASGIVFDLDPIFIEVGPFQVRYYGLVFAATLLAGFFLWRGQMLRGGHSRKLADGFLLWGVVAVVVGARLAHCLFYEPGRYLADPLAILRFWEGGLASHGATVALVIALAWYARRHRVPVLEAMDRFTFSAAAGAAGIRLGNFLNSEIVGRATDLPWAVRFVHYDQGVVARHPSQLYEFALGLAVLGVLVLADRLAGRERRPVGLLTGLFFVVYFAGRFGVEFFKEYQALEGSFLTMGQYLSIVPLLAGAALLAWSLVRARAKGAPRNGSRRGAALSGGRARRGAR